MIVLQACAFAAPAPGNFISSLLDLEKALEKRGVKTIYAFPERAKNLEWCKKIQKRTKVYFLPEAQARLKISTYQIFHKIYKENSVEIVHSHFELYDIPATIMAPPNVKIFWHLHDALKENYYKSSFTRKLLTKIQYGLVGKHATLLSVSKEHALFAEMLGFDKKQIEYVPNGIQTSRIDIKQIDQSDEKSYMLMFGWEVHRKGVDILVKAIKSLEDIENLRIKIVGQDECESYLLQENTSKVLQFSRPVSDINELYKEAVAFIHISRAEGLSYALLEAIYAGLPIICSDIPENLFAQEFKNVIWIRNESVDDLKEALLTISSEAFEIQQSDIAYNRELIEKEYSVISWTERIQNYYFL